MGGKKIINSSLDFTKEKSILFLHGYLSSGKSFIYQTEFFSNYYNVYAPDLTGFGENPVMNKPYSLDDYVLEVKKYLEKNNIVRPHVIAHSFGGRIALKTAFKYPDVFDKIVLTGSAGLKPKFSVKKCVKKFRFNILKHFVDRKKLTKFYSKDYNSLSPVMKESFKLIIGEKLDYTLNYIKNKTLIINGKDDKETPIYMAKRLNRKIKNSSLKIIDNAGHFCFIDKPFLFNYIVREFLN